MFNVWMAAYIAVLFFVLTPGVLLRLPGGRSTMVTAATHAVVFAAVYWLTHKTVWQATQNMERFVSSPMKMCPNGTLAVDGVC